MVNNVKQLREERNQLENEKQRAISAARYLTDSAADMIRDYDTSDDKAGLLGRFILSVHAYSEAILDSRPAPAAVLARLANCALDIAYANAWDTSVVESVNRLRLDQKHLKNTKLPFTSIRDEHPRRTPSPESMLDVLEMLDSGQLLQNPPRSA